MRFKLVPRKKWEVPMSEIEDMVTCMLEEPSLSALSEGNIAVQRESLADGSERLRVVEILYEVEVTHE